MKNLTLFFVLTLAVTIGCQKDSEPITNTLGDAHTAESLKQSANTEYVSPSGDMSGVTDADNIETALDIVKATGGTVHLTEGDFYTSRNIVVENFNGVLEGEGKELTIIYAGRQSAEIGFQPAFSPHWSSFPNYNDILPTVLQLDNATGDVVITNLSILVEDDQPTDIIPDVYGNDATYISTFIEIIGGEHNTVIENIRLVGKESEAFGNVKGMNAAYGIHVMLKPLVEKGKGNLIVRKIEVANLGWGAVLFMKYKDGSLISINDIKATNVGMGIYAGNIDNSSVDISNVDLYMKESSSSGISLFQISSGLEVYDCKIANGSSFSIRLERVSQANIARNTITEHQGCCWWACGIGLVASSTNNLITNNNFENMSGNGGGIFVWGNSANNVIEKNDYKRSNLPGWKESTPNGPGAILLGGDTQGNEIFEMKFPPGKGVTLCEMIWDMTDNPETPEYDGNNFIHHWKPCENRPERTLMTTQDAAELKMDKMQLQR